MAPFTMARHGKAVIPRLSLRSTRTTKRGRRPEGRSATEQEACQRAYQKSIVAWHGTCAVPWHGKCSPTETAGRAKASERGEDPAEVKPNRGKKPYSRP